MCALPPDNAVQVLIRFIHIYLSSTFAE